MKCVQDRTLRRALAWQRVLGGELRMPSNRAWVMVLVSLLHGSAPALSQPALTAATILDANRAASGGATVPATIETEYAYSGSGLTGTMHSMTDRMTGAYVDRYVIGPSRGASGFDGQRAWMQDISGASTPQDGGDRRQVAVNEAYRNANRWWRADRRGARIERVGRETVDNSEAEHLRVAPRGGKVFDAWFDSDTHHLVRVDEMQQFLHAISSLRDYAHGPRAHPTCSSSQTSASSIREAARRSPNMVARRRTTPGSPFSSARLS